MGKGEIAHYEQFLLFPVFSKQFYCRHVKPGLVRERVKKILTGLLYHKIPTFNNPEGRRLLKPLSNFSFSHNVFYDMEREIIV